MHLIQALVTRAWLIRAWSYRWVVGHCVGSGNGTWGPSQEQQVLLIAGLTLKPMSFLKSHLKKKSAGYGLITTEAVEMHCYDLRLTCSIVSSWPISETQIFFYCFYRRITEMMLGLRAE